MKGLLWLSWDHTGDRKIHFMQSIDLTFPTPEENLACDEALLDLCEEGYEHEILRFWEPCQYFVVLGYSNKMTSEINRIACRKGRVPVLRRRSGGGTVLQGPGCLNYSLILKIAGPLQSITATNEFVLQRHKDAMERVGAPLIQVQGTSDLTIGGLKFSGNAQRRRRGFLLFHGTLLLSFDISLMEEYLLRPSKQPEYRRDRSHKDFLMNVRLPADVVKETLRRCWNAAEALNKVPFARIAELAMGGYSVTEATI